jgi:cell division GTPase FtsZ
MLRIKIINNNSLSSLRGENPPERKEEIAKMTETTGFDIPEIDEKAMAEAAQEEEGIKNTNEGAVQYAFIGSGQGGSRLAESFYSFGYKKCLVVNTADSDLSKINIPDDQKLFMKMGNEQGAGKDMAKGAAAAKQYEQEILNRMKKIFGKCDRIMVCVGAGGGTGGGSLFVLLDIARKYMRYSGVEDANHKIGVICAIPKDGECASAVVAENAIQVMEPLCEYAEVGDISPLIFVDNNKTAKLYPNLTMTQYWPVINKAIAGLFNVFNSVATRHSQYTTFDRADYDKIMGSGGCQIMGATKVKDYNDKLAIGASIKANLEKTLFAEGFDLNTAKAAGSIVIGGETIFNTVPGLPESINYGFDTLANITGNAVVYRGIYQEPGNSIVVYNIISGLDRPTQRIESLRKFMKQQKTANLYGESK